MLIFLKIFIDDLMTVKKCLYLQLIINIKVVPDTNIGEIT